MKWRDRVRLLDPGRDEPALRSFQCARVREPWAVDVQDAIREFVTNEVRLGNATGFVCADGDLVAGLATLYPPVTGDELSTALGSCG